jgi:rhomboid protease GluP
MAIGFTPRHSEEFPFQELSPEHFIALAHEAVMVAGWEISHISKAGIIAYTNNGVFKSNHEIKILVDNGFVKLSSVSTGNEMWDMGKNKNCIEKFIDTFNTLRSGASEEWMTEKYSQLSAEMPEAKDDPLQMPPATLGENIRGFFTIFKPVKGFTVTPILLILNVLVFIVMVISGVGFFAPEAESLINWGANFRPNTLDGEWWRLLTCCFLHIGVFHLLMNAYALLYIGILLEPVIGSRRFLFAYLVTGIAASATSLWWNDFVVSAGASGAIFGMYGVFLALLTTKFVSKSARQGLLASIAIFVGYNLLNGLNGGIDNAAHVGGLVSGGIIGYALVLEITLPFLKVRKWIVPVSVVVLFGIGGVFLVGNISNDFGKYESTMKEFFMREQKALALFSLPEDTPKDSLLVFIQKDGITNWKESIKLLETVRQLELSEGVKKRNQQLLRYCDLRLKTYELMFKSVNEDSNEYESEIAGYNNEMEKVIKKLSEVN